jgi:hypothetical protein
MDKTKSDTNPREQVHGVSIHGKAARLRGGAALSIETKEPWCLPYLNVLELDASLPW